MARLWSDWKFAVFPARREHPLVIAFVAYL
jgi:hypothetical protein